MSCKVPTFQFFSWLSVAKARVRRTIQTGEDKVFRLFSEQNPIVGLGNKERDFCKIFVPFFARAILLHIQWSSSNKCDRKTILDDYWVEILAGKCLRCPNRLAKGFTGTKNSDLIPFYPVLEGISFRIKKLVNPYKNWNYKFVIRWKV